MPGLHTGHRYQLLLYSSDSKMIRRENPGGDIKVLKTFRRPGVYIGHRSPVASVDREFSRGLKA